MCVYVCVCVCARQVCDNCKYPILSSEVCIVEKAPLWDKACFAYELVTLLVVKHELIRAQPVVRSL